LATASLETAGIGALSWIAPVILLLSALLTAGYLLQITIHAFFRKDVSGDAAAVKEPAAMVCVLAVLALLALVGGVMAAQTGGLLSGIASSMFAR
ncbi:MAG: proton-conducting membrane transporter, partial [Clostridia bacterium]|nr:proton-conducting membrane transporter [Clostridia bacterium]